MRFKLFLTFLLLSLASGCIVTIVVIVPFIVLPSLTDDQDHYYDPVPVSCSFATKKLIENDRQTCRAWNSCRDGCDSKPRNCIRVFINYVYSSRHEERKNFTSDRHQIWAETDVALKVNVNACVDGSEINCEDFYTAVQKNSSFPCYFNRKNGQKAIFVYSWEDELYPAIFAVGLPIAIFLVFLAICAILAFWYCRGSPGYDPQDMTLATSRDAFHAFE